MKIKPLSDRVLIQPNPAEEKTAAGLIIPDTAKEKPLAGKVVAVGPGTSEVKMEVKVGDQVLYGKYAGTEVTVEAKHTSSCARATFSQSSNHFTRK